MKRSTLSMILLCLLVPTVILLGCQPPNASQKLKPVVDKYVEVWNTGNLGELDAIIDPHFVRRVNLIPTVEGVDGAKKVISGFRAAYPDLKIVVDDPNYSENRFSCRWTFTGTNTGAGEMPPTGKPVKIWGLTIAHFANGKLTGETVAYDNHAFMEQLGYTMMPPSGAKK